MRLVILLLIIFTSCNVEKKAANKINWLLSKDKLSEACSRIYPSKDSIIVKDSIWKDTIPGEVVILYDTVDCKKKDSIIYRAIKCPPCNSVIEYRVRDSIIYQRSTSEEGRLQSIINAKDKVIQEKDKIIIAKDKKIDKNDWWKIAFIILAGLNVIGVILKIKKVI